MTIDQTALQLGRLQHSAGRVAKRAWRLCRRSTARSTPDRASAMSARRSAQCSNADAIAARVIRAMHRSTIALPRFAVVASAGPRAGRIAEASVRKPTVWQVAGRSVLRSCSARKKDRPAWQCGSHPRARRQSSAPSGRAAASPWPCSAGASGAATQPCTQSTRSALTPRCGAASAVQLSAAPAWPAYHRR